MEVCHLILSSSFRLIPSTLVDHDLSHGWPLNAGLILEIYIHVSDLCPLKGSFELSSL